MLESVRRSPRLARPCTALLLLLLAAAPAALAQAPASSPDPFRFVLWTGQDATAFVKGLPSPYTLYAAAGMGGVLLLFSPREAGLTERAIELSEGTYRPARKIANEIGNVKAVRPMALMLFLGSLLSDDERLQDAAFTSLEAIVFSNLVTNTLKGVVGRARPFQEQGTTHFRPFSGNTSFPSGHATTVFAFTTPWLLYYANVPAYGLFLLGAGTAFTRMADNAHWFSDVLVGAAIGFTTGYWLTRRHLHGGSRISVTPVLSAEQPGLSLRIRP